MSIDWTRWDSDPYWSSVGQWDTRPAWVRPARPSTIRWMLNRTVAPTVEPVSLSEAKLHLRVDTTDDDAYIADLIVAAREYVEMVTQLSLLPQTWVMYLDRWPRTDRVEQWPNAGLPVGSIMIPRFPVSSITSIAWTGSDASQNTLAGSVYRTDFTSRPPRIALAPNQSWPSPSLTSTNGVQITLVSGYANAAAVPRLFRQALYLMVGHWYTNREEVMVDNRAASIELPQGAKALLGLVAPIQVG